MGFLVFGLFLWSILYTLYVWTMKTESSVLFDVGGGVSHSFTCSGSMVV